MERTPNREEIERKAYEIYEQRGREEGHAEEHWLVAEHELTKKLSVGEPAPSGSRIKATVAQALQQKSASASRR